MKFKDLPEGHYFIHRISDVIALETCTESVTYPNPDFSTIQVVHDGRKYFRRKQQLCEMEVIFKNRSDLAKERKSYGARISHITRRLNSKEPLKGKILENALSFVNSDDPDASINKDPLFVGISKKLKEGSPLSDYEIHIMVDVVLLHARLS